MDGGTRALEDFTLFPTMTLGVYSFVICHVGNYLIAYWCGAIRSDVLDSLGMVEMKGFTLCWDVVRLLLGISNGFFHYFLLPVFTEGF